MSAARSLVSPMTRFVLLAAGATFELPALVLVLVTPRAGSPRREHAILWGALRCQCDCLVVVYRAEAGIAMTEGVRERIVQHRYSHVEEGLHRCLFQRICCFLFMRLAMISLTELSTNAVEIGSPFRRRAA